MLQLSSSLAGSIGVTTAPKAAKDSISEAEISCSPNTGNLSGQIPWDPFSHHSAAELLPQRSKAADQQQPVCSPLSLFISLSLFSSFCLIEIRIQLAM